MARKSKEDSENEILGRIRQRVSDWFDYFALNNRNFRADMKFAYEEDGQWTGDEVAQYDQDERPRLTFNLLPRFLTNMAAEYASNTPDLKVRSEHFTEVAQQKIDLMNNFLRNLSLSSRNDIVYQTAANNAWGGGYGAFRIAVERERAGSFNFVARYKTITDPTLCFWDPIARSSDKTDGRYCGIAKRMAKDEFKAKYPKAKIPTSLSAYFYDNFEWFTKDSVTIVDYYEKVPIKVNYTLLSDNSSVRTEKVEEVLRQKNRAIDLQQEQFPLAPLQKITAVKSEEQDDFNIKFYRVSGNEILETSEWPGKILPIIFQAGISKWVNGRERTYSFIHWIRDAQRAYNYSISEIFYRLKLTRYEPYMATKEMVSPDVNGWKNAHKAKSVLLYKESTTGAKPERISPQEVPQSLFLALNTTFSNLQAIPGRFEANLGAPSNELSGVAINNRQTAGNLNIKEYFDNGRRAIESGARVVLDLIPKVYDTQRIVNVTTGNGETTPMQINSDPQNTLEEIFFNVTVTVGASFEIQQQRAKEVLAQAFQTVPGFAQVAPDIYAENLDIKNASQLVDRTRQYLIPQIAAAEGDKEAQQQIMKTAQQQQQQQQLQMRLLQLQLQKAQADLVESQQKSQATQMQAQSSVLSGTANLMNAQTNRAEAMTKGIIESQRTQAEQQKAELELQTEALKTLSELAKGGSENISDEDLARLGRQAGIL